MFPKTVVNIWKISTADVCRNTKAQSSNVCNVSKVINYKSEFKNFVTYGIVKFIVWCLGEVEHPVLCQ